MYIGLLEDVLTFNLRPVSRGYLLLRESYLSPTIRKPLIYLFVPFPNPFPLFKALSIYTVILNISSSYPEQEENWQRLTL